MSSLTDVTIADVLAFLREVLPPPPCSVLEIGCGYGSLAAALRDSGYHVTGLEPDPEAAERARERGVRVVEKGLLDYDGGPFDAVIGMRSLHHVARLDKAIEHALSLLIPGGVLALDEFCRERADRRAAAFFYDVRGLLFAAGLGSAHEDSRHGNGEVDPARDPLERWQEALAPSEDHPLHEGEDVRAVVAQRAEIAYSAYVPYLWRHILGTSVDEHETWAGPAATYLHAVERRRVAEGSLPPIGLRLAARAPAR